MDDSKVKVAVRVRPMNRRGERSSRVGGDRCLWYFSLGVPGGPGGHPSPRVRLRRRGRALSPPPRQLSPRSPGLGPLRPRSPPVHAALGADSPTFRFSTFHHLNLHLVAVCRKEGRAFLVSSGLRCREFFFSFFFLLLEVIVINSTINSLGAKILGKLYLSNML